jgi:nitroreductase
VRAGTISSFLRESAPRCALGSTFALVRAQLIRIPRGRYGGQLRSGATSTGVDERLGITDGGGRGSGHYRCIAMSDLADIIRHRRSERVAFDRDHHPSEADLGAIVEAARWAPTAHNMQNFEIVVVDDEAVLAEIRGVRVGVSKEFVRENYAQLSFSEQELVRKGTGLLDTMFPPSWRAPDADPGETDDFAHGFLDSTMRSCPVVLIVLYDRSKRAPASEGDVLGMISLGCVMQNMWLTAESLGLGMQIMSVFSDEHVERELSRILSIPPHMSIAFACRLGYPAAPPGRYLRVRRDLNRFVHRNAFRTTAADEYRNHVLVEVEHDC